MFRSAPHTFLQRLWTQDAAVMSARVGIVLAAIMAACWHYNRLDYVMPMFLGVIASGIGDTDDGWRGRLRTVIATLVCFLVAASTVQWVFDRHWLFAGLLCAAAFALTLLSAISERYRAIAWSTLVLSVYSATGREHHGDESRWLQVGLLMAGAAAYSVLSVGWAAVFALQPVRRRIAQVYDTLGQYLWLKASMFEPVRGVDIERRRIALAHRNVDVVQALNLAKDALLRRLPPVDPRTGVPPDIGKQESRLLLAQYFIAQDVHERASSSHVGYAELTDAFYHSDVMFRCQRTLALQGSACADVAEAIRLKRDHADDGASALALDDLQGALDHLEQTQPCETAATPANRRARQLRSLRALQQNLSALDLQLASAGRPEPVSLGETLFDSTPRTLGEVFARVRGQLRLQAPVFRHAVRLALALAAAFCVLSFMHADHGYWVLLTTLFVCQPSYGATRKRVLQRVIGTFCGLIAGWAVLRLFPDLLVQAAIAVAAGMVFFAFNKTRYGFATAAVTLVVLLGNNQTSDGAALIVPRMIDTLLGALIASVAVIGILPDWRARRLRPAAALALTTAARYLQAIAAQIGAGKRDDLAYRVARRNAHDADAALSTAVSHVLQEPGLTRGGIDAGIRFLVQSHTLLNYVSALGAHRGEGGGAAGQARFGEVSEQLAAQMNRLAQALRDKDAGLLSPQAEEEALALAESLEQQEDAVASAQLALVSRQLPLLQKAVARLVQPAPGKARG
ncbi:TIGR01666 family membrane protein [Xylophilus rhododendri]|uniref:TIGR01666 family membrane protein n=1 Tax=Xylophilus rhododendri TaxID=2697032 RepID=A0A857J825_9BURK|nr:YccS family putative transporter [Xylophilus rhododendri]QHJ00027.1 TIGR01666 family membrane protein [Xylophilus rhododendri]